MNIRTGETIYENIISIDTNGDPLSAATFSTAFFINGSSSTAITLSINLIEASTGIFNASFSSATYGYHQYRALNSINGNVFMSQIYVVRPDNELPGGATVYVGL